MSVDENGISCSSFSLSFAGYSIFHLSRYDSQKINFSGIDRNEITQKLALSNLSPFVCIGERNNHFQKFDWHFLTIPDGVEDFMVNIMHFFTMFLLSESEPHAFLLFVNCFLDFIFCEFIVCGCVCSKHTISILDFP